MRNSITPSQENYLEHIFYLSTKGDVHVRNLAESVNVKLPSVTRAINRLAEAGMVKHKTYGIIKITAKGRKTAQSIVRRDICLNRFFVDILQMDPEIAAAEVCRIEHLISDEVLNRLEVLISHYDQSNNFKKNLVKKLKNPGLLGYDDSSIKVGNYRPHA